jgi:hypothetical protein
MASDNYHVIWYQRRGRIAAAAISGTEVHWTTVPRNPHNPGPPPTKLSYRAAREFVARFDGGDLEVTS